MSADAEIKRMSREQPPYYWQSLDFARLMTDYPPPPAYFNTVYRMPRAQLRELREKRFMTQIARAREIPFYQRRWRETGLGAGDIRSVSDLTKIPPYTVHDIRDSIARNPPFGDFMGVSPEDGRRMPLVIQTSGGTTGLPRPMLYSPQDREIMAILGARRLTMHGVRPGDLVQVTRALGLANGGFHIREALWKYTGAVPVMTGSGNVTPTRRQIEIMRAWGVNVLIGFPAYLRHMALVARDELKIDPRSLGIRALDSNLGIEDRKPIEELWGAPCHDFYGAHESGMIAADCVYQNGMHIQEDAFIVEILDPVTGKPVPEGEKGNICITSLFKYSAPLIRYNICDVSLIMPGTCACGSTLVRLEKIFGRSDNMLKLRGVNVFPEAIGALVAEEPRSTGEFFCIVDRVGAVGRDEMTVLVEAADPSVDTRALHQDLERRLHDALAVKVLVKVVQRNELDQYTGVSQVTKAKRLLDRRKD
ncbi:MAG: phenylacetate--CoA ligase family protein [Betaproteobacteria bacterium]|nr:phenylacetate--CoA ligase family protein [Betaproteobacteria bacterium]